MNEAVEEEHYRYVLLVHATRWKRGTGALDHEKPSETRRHFRS